MTKVFFRPGKFAEFDQMMKSDPENLKVLVERVKKWLLVSRWKKAIWGALSVIKLKNKILYRREKIVILQKNIRMCNARRKHAHRFKGVMQIKGLQVQLNEYRHHPRSAEEEDRPLWSAKNSSLDRCIS
ncbi:UNVERIFIED_CONTAM: hypothetical protein GTU68_063757 [Idotea baltica]|nr:hypothetical protein [Idotea baltica]